MGNIETVYLFVHELFGIYRQKSEIQLLPPDVSKCKMKSHKMHKRHTYKIARFKYRTWQKPDVKMLKGHSYTLSGVVPGPRTSAKLPPHCEYNAHPADAFELAEKQAPYCRWHLDPPANIYQLRLLSIPERPLFTGKHGDAIEKQVKAISLVQVFEYERNPGKPLAIVDEKDGPIHMDYKIDKITNSVNLHLWAEIENEAGMTDDMANEHSTCSTAALVALFKDLDIKGHYSLSVDDLYSTQLPMPTSNAVKFVELMSLSERFALLHLGKSASKNTRGNTEGKRTEVNIFCSGKTCGKGSNIFVDSAE
jgi:hypothetical protein